MDETVRTPSAVDTRSEEKRTWLPFDALGSLAFATDFAALMLVGCFASYTYALLAFGRTDGFLEAFDVNAAITLIFCLLCQARGAYQPASLRVFGQPLAWSLIAWLMAFAAMAMIAFVLKVGDFLSRGATISFFVAGVPTIMVLRTIWFAYVRRGMAEGAFAHKRVLLISARGPIADRALVQSLSRYDHRPVAHVTVTAQELRNREALASVLAGAIVRAREAEAHEVIVAVDWDMLADARRITEGLRRLPLPVKLVLDPMASDLLARPATRFGRTIAVEMQRAPLTRVERALKRSFDIGVAGTALVLLAPVLAAAAVAVRIDSPGPILFRQTRHGFNNKPFKILKFRSMRVQEDGAVVRQARRDDDRITRVGRIIRRTSIDELPQLLNVLRGEMSIVGPRPHAVAHDNYYEQLIGDYAFRNHVKPGLTGWAQVNGSRGETPTVDSMALRVKYDIWYVDNWSLWLDVWIVLRTFLTLVNTRNAY